MADRPTNPGPGPGDDAPGDRRPRSGPAPSHPVGAAALLMVAVVVVLFVVAFLGARSGF